MGTGNLITEFFRKRIGNVGISSLVLAVLEKMLDTDFVCPCQPGYNEGICFCYAIVPFIACFIFNLCFVEPIPEDRKMTCNAKWDKILYSLLIAVIWLFLFFVDGQYMACAFSRWDGQYTETGSLKWCKPTRNETMLQRQQETQRYITSSQFAGFAIMVVISVILGILFYRTSPDQQNEDVPLRNRNDNQMGGS